MASSIKTLIIRVLRFASAGHEAVKLIEILYLAHFRAHRTLLLPWRQFDTKPSPKKTAWFRRL